MSYRSRFVVALFCVAVVLAAIACNDDANDPEANGGNDASNIDGNIEVDLGFTDKVLTFDDAICPFPN